MNLDTQELCLFDPETFPQTNLPNSSVAVCPSELPLVAFWEHIGPRVEIELWDYEQSQQRFRYVNTETYQSATPFAPDSNRHEVHFSPDGSLLIAKFHFQQEHLPQNLASESACALKVWDTDSAELIQETISEFRPIAGCSERSESGLLIYGSINNQIAIQGLVSEEILFKEPGKTPCHMTLDGQIIAFTTEHSNIEVWDWKQNQKLTTLDNGSQPLLHLEISQDKQFIITYSQNGSIRVWGIPAETDN